MYDCTKRPLDPGEGSTHQEVLNAGAPCRDAITAGDDATMRAFGKSRSRALYNNVGVLRVEQPRRPRLC